MRYLDDRLESEYYKYLKLPVDELYERYTHYLKFFREANSILDLGCGYGHFLELIKKEGKVGLGVDSDRGMVQIAKNKSLDVIEDNIFSFLKNTDKKFDGIFSAHLIEHLYPKQVTQLFNLCYRVLNKDGIIVIVTPNPANLTVHLCEFWKDLTHIRLYDRQLVEFLICSSGFELIESGENPETKNNAVARTQNLDDLLRYGHTTLNPLKIFKRALAKLLTKYILNHQMNVLNHQMNVLNHQINTINNYINFNSARELYVIGRK